MTANYVIGFYNGLPIDDAESFVGVEAPMPEPRTHDLIVKVNAVSVNPVDTKLRQTAKHTVHPRVLGFDAVGVVTATGSDVRDFHVGDRVLYAGSSKRAGSNQRYQAVDARIVAHAPQEVGDAELAALPLVGLTAWELLFDKMGFVPAVDANIGKTLLIINGAGGVGSMMIQLAKWAGITVLATASPNHFAWLRARGADCRIDYHDDIAREVHDHGYELMDGIAILFAPEPYLALATQLVAPFGHVGSIVLPSRPLDITALKNKAGSMDFEYMFAKTDYDHEIATQGAILAQIVELYAAGFITSDVTATLNPITVATLKEATALVEAGHMEGKIVITGGVSGE